MKPNELRIGNWVDYKGRFLTIYVIDKVMPVLDAIDLDRDVILWKDLKGIPLTEEWLERLGFDKNELSPTPSHPAHLPTLYKYVNSKLILTKYAGSGFLNKEHNMVIQYVHQLQNLYFALTGEELETKNKTT